MRLYPSGNLKQQIWASSIDVTRSSKLYLQHDLSTNPRYSYLSSKNCLSEADRCIWVDIKPISLKNIALFDLYENIVTFTNLTSGWAASGCSNGSLFTLSTTYTSEWATGTLSLWPSATPAGIWTLTVCVRVTVPFPEHCRQGVVMTRPWPWQRWHVDFMWKNPVLIDACTQWRDIL